MQIMIDPLDIGEQERLAKKATTANFYLNSFPYKAHHSHHVHLKTVFFT